MSHFRYYIIAHRDRVSTVNMIVLLGKTKNLNIPLSFKNLLYYTFNQSIIKSLPNQSYNEVKIKRTSQLNEMNPPKELCGKCVIWFGQFYK